LQNNIQAATKSVVNIDKGRTATAMYCRRQMLTTHCQHRVSDQ